jgi:catechol 2,3-dioxygenase-like lactoylglutathione lyase family enzyme
VRDLEKSIRFYQDVLSFKHEGKLDRFEIIRVHDGFTIDLIESDPKDQVHYAFCMDSWFVPRNFLKKVKLRLLS